MVWKIIPARKGGGRAGWAGVNAVKNRQLFEIKSADILQPGPAALTDGVAQLHAIVMAWAHDMPEVPKTPQNAVIYL